MHLHRGLSHGRAGQRTSWARTSTTAGPCSRGQSPTNRAEVRKPVWATMRWSGRTAWPSTCQVRCNTSSVRGASQAVEPASASRRRLACMIEGVYATRIPPVAQRADRRGARPATVRADRGRPGRPAARRCRRSSPAARRGSGRARRRPGTSARWTGPGWRSPRAARSRRSPRPPGASSSRARPTRPRTRAPGRRARCRPA